MPKQFAEQSADQRFLSHLRAILPDLRMESEVDLICAVELGLPTRAVDDLLKAGLSEKEVYSLVIPRRTLSHRRAHDRPLSHAESDRTVRVARVAALADQAFGERARALRWLRKPKHRFGGRTPLGLCATEAGARLVEEMLRQIDHGIF